MKDKIIEILKDADDNSHLFSDIATRIDSLYSRGVSEKKFIRWIAFKADKIYLEQMLGWRTVEELYNDFLKSDQSHPTPDISEEEIEDMVDNEIPFDEDEAIADEYNRYFFKRGIKAAIKKWVISKEVKPEVAHCTQCGYHYDSLLKECPTCKGVKPTSEENRENIITEINNEIQPHAITLEHGEKATQAVYDLIYGKN
jgi:hypothetical protein